MSYRTRLDQAWLHTLTLPLHPDSGYILFSDCHRADGRANDNFLKNEFLYLAALRYYDRRGYTYLELGDGDELWENRSMEKIKEMHPHSFELLARLQSERRAYFIYGNHDLQKKDAGFCKKYLSTYRNSHSLRDHPLFPDSCFYSGILLEDPLHKKNIFLTHGHQVEIMNSTFCKVNRFLVRYLWKNLELLGAPDPTSAAKNNTKKDRAEKRLCAWASENNLILIAGHTHRPMTGSKNSPYFNTGSCVHPAGITGIEIEHRTITLVKWSLGTKSDQTVYVKREVLGENVRIDDC